jgi:hypothetical protein
MENQESEINLAREAKEALDDPITVTEAELAAGYQAWVADLKGGALKNLDDLIARDHGTTREPMFRKMRDGYAEEFGESVEAAKW